MAGSEKTGPTHARADLFAGRVSVVTPTARSSNTARDKIEEFWRSLGAKVVRLSPREHDRTVAMISHLPHLIASAVAAATPDHDLPLASTGWLDTTRIAAGDPELWRQILSDNRADVLKSLGKFEKVLTSFRRALERDDQRKLIQLLEAGKQRREALGN
jgi:prephenate dehydrogenase